MSHISQIYADKPFMVYRVFIFLMLGFSLAHGAAPTTKLHVFRHLYTGEEKETFTEKTPGVGAEMIITTRESHFNFYTKGRLSYITGNQVFDDSGVERKSDFTYYQSTFELGGTLYPLPRKSKSMNIYLGVGAIVSYNYMSLESEAFTKIKPSYQAISFGYAGLMGLEWFLFDSSDWCVSLEFSQRYETANLAEQSSFNLGGFNISFGLAW